MKIKATITAALIVAATSAFAALPFEYVDWVNGPVQFIMSKDELAKFRTLQSGAEAEAFVDLFWARRDPTPDTPRNEAKEQFDARVEYADKSLKDGSRLRGAMTDRGKTLILYGQPKRIERASAERSANFDLSGALQKDERFSDNWVQWIYEGDDVKNLFLVPKATIRFVDKMGTEDYRVERGQVDLAASQQRAIQRMVLHPELKEPPVFTAAAAPAPVEPAVPAAPVTALTTAALTTAVNELKAAAKNPNENQVFATWGEYVTSFGEYFVPVMVSVPASAGLAADQKATFFGVIEDESGKPVLAFEESRTLNAANGDLFVDKSLSLPAGKHRGYFGVSQNGKTLIASADMQLAGTLDKDAAAASPVLVSNFIQPLSEAQAPTEPFAFGGVKVVPKADKTFRTSDELWYFFELRNPGLADALPAELGSATGAPPEQKPKVQVKMDVEGKDAEGKAVRKSAPPREIDAVPMKGVPGHYGVGNAIPLESFKPGEYTLTVKVMDTVKKASYTLSEKFKVIQ